MAKRKAPTAEPLLADRPAEYTVLARRYRPQQFADLVGQEPVAQALVNALQSGRVAHAYLFTGARGVGKTSTARILAKALNCVKGPTPTPCDECDSCRSIATGEDIDVVEIDGASNRLIDDIRELRSNVQYRPSRSRFKIYIIDEVHALTRDAFNALLKTLEEPPPHVKFIFATTEAHKVPLTILSRCQRFDFAGIGMARIVERLKAIVASEGMTADDDALELIARRAGGSMRDAQSLLDQLLAFGSDRLTTAEVHQLLGTANEDRVVELATAVLDNKPQLALELLGRAADEGLQLAELLDQLIEYWRDLMVVNCGGSQKQALSVTGVHREGLSRQAQSTSTETILAGLDVLASTKARLRNSQHGRVLLEMALVRLSRLEDLVSLTQLAQWVANKNGEGNNKRPRPSAGPGALPPSAGAGTSPTISNEKKKPDDLAPVSPELLVLTKENLARIWERMLGQVGGLFAAELKKVADVAISAPNTLVLRFPARYNHSGEQSLDPNRVARLEEALWKITGSRCNLRIDPSADDGPVVSPAHGVEAPETSPPRSRRHRAEAMQLPLIARAMEVLGAQIVQLDEDFGAAPASPAPRPEPAGSEEP
jgi:DNA polymerase-3 subunit gamma/tau